MENSNGRSASHSVDDGEESAFDYGGDERAPIRVQPPETAATGLPAIVSTAVDSMAAMGAVRSIKTLAVINQPDGYDCPGCAWPEPEPEQRKRITFCENGAKAVAEEATTDRVGRDFFESHSYEDLRVRSDYWLGAAGRLTEPMIRRAGATHFEPIGWHDAFAEIATTLHGLRSPDEAIFYTSGRTANEQAFLYQLFVRCFGTNNMPDCSNMCHEPSGAALSAAIGIGKGSVRLDDFYESDLIVIAGQNPGTNHPRMLAALETAKENGARIIAVNPLPEAGLLRFKNPQRPDGIVGDGTELADIHLPIQLGADQALFQLFGAWMVADADTGRVELDDSFIAQYTSGFDEYADHLRTLDTSELLSATGLDEQDVRDAYEMIAAADRMIVCWAMGVTQHRNGVESIREITNLALLGGHIGRTGAGLCPVRGHSNVQGDRTMGVWEHVEPAFVHALEAEFGLQDLPRQDGWNTVESVAAVRDGKAKVFFSMGGNFARATPDTNVVESGFADLDLVVNVSTKLNRSHLITDQTSIILPTLGRTDVDRRNGDGDAGQMVTVEDSMGKVHGSTGLLQPPSDELLSEVQIVCGLAQAVLGADHVVPWSDFANDYDLIRDRIAATVGGFEDFNERVRIPGGFELPHPARDSRTFLTSDGKAQFAATTYRAPDRKPGELMLQTTRSHDQYNTTIYGHDDRYRGLEGDRHVVMVNPTDIHDMGLNDGDWVDLITALDGPERRVRRYRLTAYPTPVGTAAAYFPETNVLVPLDHHEPESHTPASKSVPIRIEPHSGSGRGS